MKNTSIYFEKVLALEFSRKRARMKNRRVVLGVLIAVVSTLLVSLFIIGCVDMGTPANRAPTVVNAIGDITGRTTADSGNFTVSLAGVFNDADGDSLSYSAAVTAGNTVITAASVSGTTLTLTQAAVAGTATIRVTASDGKGGSAFDDFDVTVTTASPTNNPPTVANQIADVSRTTAQIGDFPVALANVFTDSDSGDTLSYTAEITAGNTVITAASVSGTTLTLTQAAVAGTATIRVTASDGNGGSVFDDFNVVVAAQSGPPDLTVTLSSTAAESVLPGSMTSRTVTVNNVGGTASVATNLTFYRSEDATIDSGDIPLNGMGGVNIGAITAGGSTAAQTFDYQHDRTTGSYYLGACVGVVTGETNTGNNCSTGVEITVALTGDLLSGLPTGTYPTGIDVANNSDIFDINIVRNSSQYYRIVAPGTSFRAFTHGGGNTVGHLYDSTGTAVTGFETDDNSGADNNFLLSPTGLTAGSTYYVRVERTGGSLTEAYSLHIGDGAPDYIITALTLVPAGGVGVLNVPTGYVVAHTATVRNDGNLASVDVPSVSVYRRTNGNLGVGPGSGNSAKDGSSVPIPALAGKTNFAYTFGRQVSSTTAAYNLCVDAVTGETASNAASNCGKGTGGNGGGTGTFDSITLSNTTADYERVAVTLTQGTPFTTSLNVNGERDYYKIVLGSSATITVSTSGSTDTEGTLYTSSISSVATDADSGTGNNFSITTASQSAGTYYVVVTGKNNATGEYTITWQ